MMINHLKPALLALSLSALLSIQASASPVLRNDIAVTSAVVTVGDMFSNPGINAERPLFRAPAPGTIGAVSIDAIHTAATRAGLETFENPGISRVRVTRESIAVDEQLIQQMISDDLTNRGIISGDVSALLTFSTALTTTYAARSDEPVRLTDLRYTPGSDTFSARFVLAGIERPLDIRGRLDLMIEAPHLKDSVARGAILSIDDIEMRPMQLRFAQNGDIARIEDLVGKEMRRPARIGMLVRTGDVTEPEIIKRSELVTLYYQNGPLRLTVKGQALNAAAKGEAVSVINLGSRKVVHGIALEKGTVEMVSPHHQSSQIQS